MDVKVYMLRNNLTGLYYLRSNGPPAWRKQENASVWTSKLGPSGAKHKAKGSNRRFNKKPVDLEIVTFRMVEDNGC
jgi:hypothetical protein